MTATVVFLHAHPDDETVFTGGTIRRLVDEGHRAVIVTATAGERGHDYSAQPVAGALLGQRRCEELRRAAVILGADSVLLGFGDSGADGKAMGGFAGCDPATLSDQVASVLVELGTDILVTYDERGGYGHPDHVQAHRVGMLAAAAAGVSAVFWATFDHDRLRSLLDLASAFGVAVDDEARSWALALGIAGDRITTTVDVRAFVAAKRRALHAHGTQFPASSFVWTLPPSAFELLFGTEYFVAAGVAGVGAWPLQG